MKKLIDSSIANFSGGAKFYMPTYDELIKLGWQDATHITLDKGLWHEDIGNRNFIIHETMYNDFGGTWVTIDFPLTSHSDGLYRIIEDDSNWCWPLYVLHEQWNNYNFMQGITCNHEEGITPIDGWFICKHCGDNLREIK